VSLIDIHSDTWATVKAVCEASIEASHRALERHGLTDIDAEYERGRLSHARAILALAAKPAAKPDIPTPYTY